VKNSVMGALNLVSLIVRNHGSPCIVSFRSREVIICGFAAIFELFAFELFRNKTPQCAFLMSVLFLYSRLLIFQAVISYY